MNINNVKLITSPCQEEIFISFSVVFKLFYSCVFLVVMKQKKKKLFLLLVFSIYLKVHNISNIIMLIIDSITNLVKDVSRLFKNDFSKNITKKTVFSHKPENF